MFSPGPGSDNALAVRLIAHRSVLLTPSPSARDQRVERRASCPALGRCSPKIPLFCRAADTPSALISLSGILRMGRWPDVYECERAIRLDPDGGACLFRRPIAT